jgi:hypothetical protein
MNPRIDRIRFRRTAARTRIPKKPNAAGVMAI